MHKAGWGIKIHIGINTVGMLDVSIACVVTLTALLPYAFYEHITD
jgi:hypothetical protein